MMIGNTNFKMKKFINKSENELLFNYNLYKTIFECYDRPSSEKIDIYNYWRNLLLNNCDEVLYYGVDSYNRWMFTLHAIVKIDNIFHYVYITKTRNEIKVIKED